MKAADLISQEELQSIPAVETGGKPASPVPQVSVLMLAHNHEEYVREAIESILRQKSCSYELLIGEDCSTDGTAAICQEFKVQRPNVIRLIMGQERVGMHRNFARLWFRARGRYVAICEGDDYWTDPQKLAKQFSYLEGHPSVSMVAAYTRKISQAANGDWVGCGEVVPPEVKAVYSVEDLIPSYSFHTSSVMLRKSMIQFPRWLWSTYCVDRPLYLIAAEQGEVGCLPEYMSVYRLTAGGSWAPLTGLEKARDGIKLFDLIDWHFDGRYHRLVRGTVAGIVWSYMGQALNAGDRKSARRLYLQVLRYASSRLPAPPSLMAKAAVRCCVP